MTGRMLKIGLLMMGVMLSVNSFGQEKYWVFFTDKDGVEFDPYTYFDQKALDRREAHGIPILHYSDFPVNPEYIQAVVAEVDSVSWSSRWFNALSIYAQPDQLERVERLPFVKSIEPMELVSQPAVNKIVRIFDTELSETNEKILNTQLTRMGLELFEAQEIDGSGIRVAIFDAGFPSVDVNPVFKHIRDDKRIKGTYDFVKKKENVYGFHSHGTMVMSNIGGITNGKKIGLATGAEFLLARTESSFSERFVEEENWLAAAEWADKNGADIINSSLGYTHRRYFDFEMNGKVSLVARAANMAAGKGMLVVNAAGNEGSNSWVIIGTPADADSVLSIGGIDPFTDYHISFSSYGPTQDGRVKPNVSAFGHAIVANARGLTDAHGTSFASPLVAGFAACVWQKYRSYTNMQLFKEIEHSGHLYPYFDYAHGYGVPQASYFLDKKDVMPDPTLELVADDFSVKVVVKEEHLEPAPKEAESIAEAIAEATDQEDYLYYHIQEKDGRLRKYLIIRVEQKEPLKFHFDDFQGGETIRVFYRGYTASYTIDK